MLAIVCLSVVAAMSLWRLLSRIGPKARAVVMAIVVAGVLVDSWIEPLPLRTLPDRWQTLEALPSGTAVRHGIRWRVAHRTSSLWISGCPT